VVGDPARVQGVVEAVRDHVIGAYPGDPEGLPADRAVRLVVAAREADRNGLSGGPRGHVHAHEPLARRAEVRPEGRVRALSLAQLLLGRERQLREVRRRSDAFAYAVQALAVERTRRLEVPELLLERVHPRGGRSPAPARSSAALTVRP
jgi:hypothetical protein